MHTRPSEWYTKIPLFIGARVVSVITNPLSVVSMTDDCHVHVLEIRVQRLYRRGATGIYIVLGIAAPSFTTPPQALSRSSLPAVYGIPPYTNSAQIQ